MFLRLKRGVSEFLGKESHGRMPSRLQAQDCLDHVDMGFIAASGRCRNDIEALLAIGNPISE